MAADSGRSGSLMQSSRCLEQRRHPGHHLNAILMSPLQVNSRHRLHHAAELPALGAAGNMVWTVYVSSAGEQRQTGLSLVDSDLKDRQDFNRLSPLAAASNVVRTVSVSTAGGLIERYR